VRTLPRHRAIAPALEELARELDGRARVLKVDVDEHPELAREHRVSSIPCLVVFKNGREVRRFVGITPKARLADALDEAGAAA
jgi:thioredoxin 1